MNNKAKERIEEAHAGEYLEEVFLASLREKGFTLQDYSHTDYEESGAGIHALILKWDGKTKITWGELEEICTQDDDNQPQATYRFYIDTLFLFIPYFP